MAIVAPAALVLVRPSHSHPSEEAGAQADSICSARSVMSSLNVVSRDSDTMIRSLETGESPRSSRAMR